MQIAPSLQLIHLAEDDGTDSAQVTFHTQVKAVCMSFFNKHKEFN